MSVFLLVIQWEASIVFREDHPDLIEERKKSDLPEKPKTPQQLWYNHEKKAYMKIHPEVKEFGRGKKPSGHSLSRILLCWHSKYKELELCNWIKFQLATYLHKIQFKCFFLIFESISALTVYGKTYTHFSMSDACR